MRTIYIILIIFSSCTVKVEEKEENGKDSVIVTIPTHPDSSSIPEPVERPQIWLSSETGMPAGEVVGGDRDQMIGKLTLSLLRN